MERRCTDLLHRIKIEVIPGLTGQASELSLPGAMQAELQPRSSFHLLTLNSLKTELVLC